MLLTCVTGYRLQRPFHLKSICTHFEPNERASQAKHEDRFVDYPLHLPLPLSLALHPLNLWSASR